MRRYGLCGLAIALLSQGLLLSSEALGEQDWIFRDPENGASPASDQQRDHGLALPSDLRYEWEDAGSTPSHSTKKPDALSQSYDTPAELLLDEPVSRKPRDKVFGRYRIHLGAMKPDFSNIVSYSDHYGSTSTAPTIAAEYYPFDFYLTLGLRFQTSLYSDKGKASLSAEGFQPDGSQQTRFSMTPLQMALVGQFPLMPRNWLVASGWFGFERVVLQEVRQTAEGEPGSKVFVNRATKTTNIVGAALSVRISPEGGGRSAGFVSAVSYRYIYFTPYIELVNAAGSGMDVGGQRLGLLFTFELH